MSVCGQKAGNKQRRWTESPLCTKATLPSIWPDSPCPAPSPAAATPRSNTGETEEARVEKTSAVGKLATAAWHKKAWKLTGCVWLCFAHTLSWTPGNSSGYFLSTWGKMYFFTSVCAISSASFSFLTLFMCRSQTVFQWGIFILVY